MTIPLVESEATLENSFKEQFAEGVDVVIDYLWEKSTECLLIAGAKSGAEAVPIRFVQIGAVSGPNITLPSAVLRSSAIELIGSIGSIPVHRFVQAIGGLLEATVSGGFKIAANPVPLSKIEQAWPQNDSAHSTVLIRDVRQMHDADLYPDGSHHGLFVARRFAAAGDLGPPSAALVFKLARRSSLSVLGANAL